jgi:hypothetical protein
MGDEICALCCDMLVRPERPMRGAMFYRRTEHSQGITEKLGARNRVMCGDQHYQSLDPATSGVSKFPNGFQTAWKLKQAGETRNQMFEVSMNILYLRSLVSV